MVHMPAGWFVVGLGRNGMEYSALLIVCLGLLACERSTPGTGAPIGVAVKPQAQAARKPVLAFKDSECTGNDMTWAVWQGTYGFDTAASGSTVGATSVLTGSGPGVGLPAGNAMRTRRGHQYP